MAPGVFDGTVYISTVPGNTKSFYKGNGAGRALGARRRDRQGEVEVLDGARGPLGRPATEINSGGGLWHPPAFDDDGNMYVDVANPAPWPGTKEFPWATSRPGPNLVHERARQAEPRRPAR